MQIHHVEIHVCSSVLVCVSMQVVRGSVVGYLNAFSKSVVPDASPWRSLMRKKMLSGHWFRHMFFRPPGFDVVPV